MGFKRKKTLDGSSVTSKKNDRLNKIKKFLTTSKYRHFVFIGAFAFIGLIGLVATNAYSIRTESIGAKISACSDNAAIRCRDGAVFSGGAVLFNGTPSTEHDNHTNAPVTNPTAAIMLPNTLEFNRWPQINAKADVANTSVETGRNANAASAPPVNPSEGQFRLYCKYSHFNYDDPIVYPGQSGKAHLHMYWGNTRTNAHTNDKTLTTSGGGTCNGYELNRTAYWMPALQDGSGNVILPKSIIVYYKTRGVPQTTSRMPQGLKMIAGNAQGNASNSYGRTNVGWHCYDGSASWTNGGYTIPKSCPPNHYLEAVIYFQWCWDQSKGLGRDSVYFPQGNECSAGHTKLPQTSYHVGFWPAADMSQWHLSSDRMPGTAAKPNGSTLHADWYGGWNDSIMDEWINGCSKYPRNCSNGLTGTRQLTGFWDSITGYGTDYIGGPQGVYKPIPK